MCPQLHRAAQMLAQGGCWEAMRIQVPHVGCTLRCHGLGMVTARIHSCIQDATQAETSTFGLFLLADSRGTVVPLELRSSAAAVGGGTLVS